MNEIERAVSEVERLKAELEEAEKNMNTLIQKEKWKTGQNQIKKDNRIKSKMTRNKMENEYLELFPDTELANSIISGEDYDFNLVISALKDAKPVLEQIKSLEEDLADRKERYGEGYNEETDEWTKLKKQDIAEQKKKLNAILGERDSIDEAESRKRNQIEQKRLERKLKANKEKFSSETSDVQDYDIAEKAAQMTEEEMNYVLDVQKIALESNVSLKEAEKMYMAAKQKDVESEEKEEVPEEVEVPTPEKVEEKEPETKEQTSNRVKVKSLDMIGVVLSHDSNDLYKVQIDGQDGRSIVEVPASDLEIVDVPEEVKEEPITDLKPEDVDVEAKPGLKDTMRIPSPEMRAALKVSEEPEEKPRKVVTKIVNKITEPFKKAISKGREAIGNFLRRDKEEVPSEEELKEGYAKEGLSEEEIMKKATPEDASKEEYSEAYKKAGIDEKQAISDVSEIINNGDEFDPMNKR